MKGNLDGPIRTRTPMILALALLLAASPQVEPPEFFAPNAELRAYLLEAAKDNPDLRRLYEEWRAAMERIPQATSLDDPRFTYTQFIQSDQSRLGFGLMQEFPWFGTLKARGEVAALEAEAALARFYAARNALFQDVKQAYYDYAFLGQSIETTRAEARLLTEMEENVGTRYGLGLAAEADLLRVQIEQSTLEDRYNEFLQQRPVASARLAALLGRETSDLLPWPQKSELPPAPPPAPVVLARLRVLSPLLDEADRLIDSRRASIELARKAGRPNFSLGLEYVDMKQPEMMPDEWPYRLYVQGGTQLLTTGMLDARGLAREAAMEATMDELMPDPDSMDDEIMISVGVTLPIWRNRVRAGIREAKHMEQAAVSEKRARILALDVAAREAIFQMRDARRRFDLYTDILIPRARQTWESLQAKYSAGDQTASFLDVLGSVQVLLNYELEQLRAERDLQVGAARLERIMGGPWSIAEAEPVPEPETVPENGESEASEPHALAEESPLP